MNEHTPQSQNKSSDEVRHLMMAVLDGEASAQQSQHFETLLAQDDALRKEFEDMKSLKELTMKSRPAEARPEHWDTYWQGVYSRLERRIGWVFFTIGAVLLILFAAWEMGREWLLNEAMPLWVRLAGVSLALGTSILLVSVVREKLFLHRHDRYKDIQR
jgi:anti-sigma factor RsiW